MNTESLISLVGLIVAAIGILTNFFLQREAKMIRELESKNKSQRVKLRKALNAIKGYQLIEEEQASVEGMGVSTFRSQVRKDKREFFDKTFLAPGRVQEMLNDLDNE